MTTTVAGTPPVEVWCPSSNPMVRDKLVELLFRDTKHLETSEGDASSSAMSTNKMAKMRGSSSLTPTSQRLRQRIRESLGAAKNMSIPTSPASGCSSPTEQAKDKDHNLSILLGREQFEQMVKSGNSLSKHSQASGENAATVSNNSTDALQKSPKNEFVNREGGYDDEERPVAGAPRRLRLDFLSRSMHERTLTSRSSSAEDVELLMWTYGLGVKKAQDLDAQRLEKGLQATSKRWWRLWSSVLQRSPFCYWTASSVKFRAITGSLITVNIVTSAILATYEIEMMISGQHGPLQEFLERMELFLSVTFIIEISIRILGSPLSKPWQDGWLILDSMVTFVNALDLWLFVPLGSSSGTLSAISSFRCLRVCRAVGAARLVRLFRPLRMLAETLSESFRQTLWITVVVLLFTFTVAIVFTGTMGILPLPEGGYTTKHMELIRPDDISVHSEIRNDADDKGFFAVTPYDAFESVASSMLTLISILLRGLRWGPLLLRPLLYSSEFAYYFSGLLLLAFIAFSLVCLANLITGMIVSSLMETARKDAAIVDHESLAAGDGSLTILKEAYIQMDLNGDGMLSWREFKRGFSMIPQIGTHFGIDVKQADALFRQLDDNESGLVNIDEFLIGLIKLTRSAKRIDLLSIDYQQQKTFRDLREMGKSYASEFQRMKGHVLAIDTKLDKIHRDVMALRKGVEESKRNQNQPKPATRPTKFEGRRMSRASTPRAKPRREQSNAENLEIFPSCASTLILEGQPYKRQALKILAEMEAKWNFEARLEGLEDALDSIGEDADERVVAIQEGCLAAVEGSSASSSATKAKVSDKVSENSHQVWRDLLFDEVMPWLRRTLATMRFPDRAAAAGRASRGGAVASPDVFIGALGGAVWARPLDNTLTPAGDWT